MTEVIINGIMTCDTQSVSLSRVQRSTTFLPSDNTLIDYLAQSVVFKEYRDGGFRKIQCFNMIQYTISAQRVHCFWFERIDITTTETIP